MLESRGEYKEIERAIGMNELADRLYSELPSGRWVSLETFGRDSWQSTPRKMAFGILLAQRRIKISDSPRGTRIAQVVR